jgi:hypothetical protein
MKISGLLRRVEDEKEQDCGGWRKGAKRIGYRLFDDLGFGVNPTSTPGIMCCSVQLSDRIFFSTEQQLGELNKTEMKFRLRHRYQSFWHM